MEATETLAKLGGRRVLRAGLMTALAALAANLTMTASSRGQTSPPPPQIRFDAVNFLNLPKDMYLGEVSGVAVNKQGHVFVFNRGNTSGPQQEGHEVRRDMCKRLVVQRGRLISEGKFLRHPRLPFLLLGRW